VWEIVGQSKVVSLLQHSLEKQATAHAYLLVGPRHVGKMTLARDLAKALNCTATEPPCGECDSCQKIARGKHTDIQVIGLGSSNNGTAETRSQAEISIDQIRELQHSANLPPFEGKHKAFLIDQAELLSHEAANCLLKTLEEPSPRVVFLLLTTNEKLLPATVVSRCQRLELSPLTVTEVESALITRWGATPDKARLLARLCHGCLGWAISATSDDSLMQDRTNQLAKLLGIIDANNEGRFDQASQLATQFTQNRDALPQVFDLWLDWWRDLLLIKVDLSDLVTNVDLLDSLTNRAQDYTLPQIRRVIDSIQTTGEQLRQNVNPRLALEVLMLSIPAKEAVKNG
jgi:DNA polymerase-3 subunit delta'